MIDKLHGIITKINICEVNILSNSIEFTLHVPNAIKLELNKNTIIETFLHFNSENGFSLFGFISNIEKEVFKLLISCSGIGPKMAINMLNSLDVSIIIDAILQNKPKILTQVSGIGIKKAEMIILELKGSIEKKIGLFNKEKLSSKLNNLDYLIQALTHLGYNNNEINKGINEVLKIPEIENLEFVDLMRLTLNHI